MVHDCRRAPEPLALRTGTPEAGFHALDDQAALQLGHGTENREHHVFDVVWDSYRAARIELDAKGGLRALDPSAFPGDGNWRPRHRPLLQDFCSDFVLAGRRALAGRQVASRRILFEVYYVGLAEYECARRFLGISELCWVQWTEQIRDLVGAELERAGVFPVRRYFREPIYVKADSFSDSTVAVETAEAFR